MDEQSELRLELKRDFTEFLDQDFGRETGVGRYVQKVDDIIKQYSQTKRVRLEVDLQGELPIDGAALARRTNSCCLLRLSPRTALAQHLSRLLQTCRTTTPSCTAVP
jgi:hypothetical protein